MAEQENTEQQPKAAYVRDPDDFETLYANSVIAESSVWDLKVIFGILDQSSQPHKVVQHTSVNLPWTQIKLLTYSMRASLLVHEAENGKVIIPNSVMPPDPDKLDLSSLPPALVESLRKLYKEFLSTL
jgi:hypothetical protein